MNRGKSKNSREAGYATIFVLMLAVAVFILLGFALKSLYSVHKQNRKYRQQVINKVEQLNNSQ